MNKIAIEKNKRPEGILPNIVTYLCFKASPLSATQLTKLVYLVDVYHWQMFGKRLTEIKFTHYFHGVWAPDIFKALEELYAQGILYEEVVQTTKGFHAFIPKPRVSQTVIRLPKTAFEALDNVLADWGDKTTDEVVQFTKSTLPFLNTAFGDEIDFSRTSAIEEYAKEKGISETEAATIDIISDKELLKNILQGDKDLREGRILTHKALLENPKINYFQKKIVKSVPKLTQFLKTKGLTRCPNLI